MPVITLLSPPSKSLSHRVIIAAALSQGTSQLCNVLESADTARTRDVFTALGAGFNRTGEGEFTVHGIGGNIESRTDSRPLDIFVGESGTTCRLVTAILGAGKGEFRIHGAGRMHERPVQELAEVLQKLGAKIEYEQKPGCPPLILTADGLNASCLPLEDEGMVRMGCDESSQYLSGLLLAAPLGGGMTILLDGKKPVSWPYVSLTLDTLEQFGISFAVERLSDGKWQVMDWRTLTEAKPGEVRFTVNSGTYQPGLHTVEGDWSGASYFLAAGAIGPNPVQVNGLNVNSLQGDAALLEILERMGAAVEVDGERVIVYPASLTGIDVDMGLCPDLVPTVAALATHARGVTRITGAAHLKIKESDRIAAPAQELRKVGCEVTIRDDGMEIVAPQGGPKAPGNGVIFSAHNDHRIAMSVGLLGLKGIDGAKGFTVVLDDPDCVSKSFPYFWMRWGLLQQGEDAETIPEKW